MNLPLLSWRLGNTHTHRASQCSVQSPLACYLGCPHLNISDYMYLDIFDQ